MKIRYRKVYWGNREYEIEEVKYGQDWLQVRGGAWNDIMNRCMFTVVAICDGFEICYDKDGKFFALRR